MPGRPSSWLPGVPEAIPTCPATATPIPTGAFSGTVSSVGDNGPFALERLPTVGVAVPALVTIRVPAGSRFELQDWVLDVGTDATDAFHQRPNDYSFPGNARCWVRYR